MPSKDEVGNPRVPLSIKLLRAYYPRVSSILDYILAICRVSSQNESLAFDDLKGYLLREDDFQGYKELLLFGVVGYEKLRDVKFEASPASMSLCDVIGRSQEKILTRDGGKANNTITQGYRLSAQRGENRKGQGNRTGITNFFVNTMVTALQSSEWEILLDRLGGDIILHLITETSIFIALPNACFCQLTGVPVIYLKPHTEQLHSIGEQGAASYDIHSDRCSEKRLLGEDPNDDMERPRKRRKTSHPNIVFSENAPRANLKTRGKVAMSMTSSVLNNRPSLLVDPVQRLPSEILFARASMFYSRPTRQLRTGHIMIGLPSQHVLNKVKATFWEESHNLAQDPVKSKRDSEFKARHVSKYVFPRQYKLGNVFAQADTSAFWGKYGQFNRRKYHDREDEILKMGPCKTPKRLKEALVLIEQMIQRHGKCGYLPLLNLACPSKMKKTGSDETLDSSVILEYVSEQSSELQSQLPLDYERSVLSDMTGVPMSGNSTAKSHAKYKPRFAEFTCTHSQVFRYVRLVTKAVIPRELFGCDKNYKLILKYVKQFIKDNRFETTSLHYVLQGVSTTECDWTLPHKPSMHRYKRHDVHVPATESAIRRELLEEFMFWYFDSFLIPLLKTTFYITDSSAFRRRVLYFRQDDWDLLCQPLVDRLVSNTFERVEQKEAEDLLRHRKLGYSFVRLLPKETGVRPIVNLRRRRKQGKGNLEQNQSINQILQTAFQILTYEKNAHEERMGGTVFSNNEIYLKLVQFKKANIDCHGRLPRLYFVKVDVKACFDTIDQNKLLHILKDLVSEDIYMIQRYGVVAPATGKISRTYVKRALPECEHPHFLRYAKQLASLLRNAIVSDQVVYPFAYRENIEQLLEDHIKCNLVKNYYRQVVGIPQGSVLSSLLCSFFYGDLEQTSLRFTTGDPGSVLLRLIDDYLFVTTDISKAKKFIEVMERGHPEYGCFISPEKTLTNFDDFSDPTGRIQKLFPWCGLLINTQNLSVLCDYSRFHDTYLTDSLTVERCSHPGSAFTQKMLQLAKQKCHLIHTDMALNKRGAVIVNVHQSFVMTAMKMHAYLRHLGRIGGALNGSGSISKGRKGTVLSGCALKMKRKSEGGFLLKVIRQIIRYTYASIHNKFSTVIAEKAGSVCTLTQDVISWLGLHAFFNVLRRKPTLFTRAGVLDGLKRDLANSRYEKIKRKLGGVAKRSLDSVLEDIDF